jgi:hypothetical protein
VTIQNRLPLALSYDSNNTPSGLAEFQISSVDLADVATDHAPEQYQVLAWSAVGDGTFLYAPSTLTNTDPGVTKIVAGTNVSISPTNGLGEVTINSTGGGGASFPNGSTGDILYYHTDGTSVTSIDPTATPLNLATTGYVASELADYATNVKLAATGASLILTQAALAATGAALATTNSNLAATGAALATTNTNLAATGASLILTQTALAATGAALATTNSNLATTGAALATTNSNLAATGAALITTQTALAATGAALVITNTNLAATAAAAVQVANTTAGSRTFLGTDANFDDITNVTLTGDTKAQLVLRTGDFITASSLNDGAIDFLFTDTGGGEGLIDFTPSSSGGGSTLVSENVSATNLSAVNGTVTTAPTTGNHVANKTYVDGINNTQHNRLFAVGTKTDSIANTAVYLGWEFDAVSALSVSDSGGVITIGGTGNTEITFGEAGDYMIDCTARCNANNRIELFVKGEYYDASQESPAFVAYNRLQNSNYAARDTDQNTGGTTLSLLLSLNQNDKLRFEAEADADGTAVLLVNGTFLRIVKLA